MRTGPVINRYVVALGGISLIALGTYVPASIAQVAADKSHLARFDAAASDSTQVIDYQVVDTILESFVIGNGRAAQVRYQALKGDGERILTELVSGFAAVDPTKLNADEQLAYWLNLRMLMVLRSTAQALPGAKAEKLLQPGSAFYTTRLAKVAGVDLSIDDIDAIVLKRAASNPNIVYGLVLPVNEAPSFPRKGYRGATVRAALDETARAFINRPGAVKTNADTVKVPQFLISHRARLGGDDTAVLAHIRSLAVPKLEQKLMMAAHLTPDTKLSLNAFVERSFADQNPGFGFGGGQSGGGGAGS